MNQALFLISLQHELSMSIGTELKLDAMLKTFLKVCLNRVHLSSCHVYLYQNSKQQPVKLEHSINSNLEHFISVPKRQNGALWQVNPQLKAFEKSLIDNLSASYFEQKIEREYYYAFKLPQQGYLIWHSKHALADDIKKAISPMLDKLAGSCYASIVHDELSAAVQARQVAEEKVDHQASHDGLTNLYNREYISLLIEKAFIHADFNNNLSAIIFIDLNKFKPINDTMGHAVGDKILIEVANRLNAFSKKNIITARFGGDEFIILINKLPLEQAIAKQQTANFIEQINASFQPPIVVDDTSYNMTLSIGYCLLPAEVGSAADAIKFADIAMYEAKREKIFNGLEYQPYMSNRLTEKEAYIREMKHGLANGEFMLYYQPQYNDNNQIIGAEALLRWNNPTRGMESPQVYIPIAEESNLILDIGNWVIEQACQDIKRIEQLNLPKSFKKVAINVSPKQLIQTSFSQNILNNVEKTGITPQLLNLELTEGLLIERFQETIDIMLVLKAQGIDCSIDDFGTGYSSLTYLKRIPATLIKIDRSFVDNIHQDLESTAIAEMIIALGKSLNMEVLAEGVETIEELTCLKALGCSKYQGYYFNRPMPFEDFLQLLN